MARRRTSARGSKGSAVLVLLLACSPQVGLEVGGSSSSATTSEGSPTTSMGPSTSPTTTSATMTTGTVELTTTGVDPDEGGSSTGVVISEDCSLVEQDCPAGYKCMPWPSPDGSLGDTMCLPIVDDPHAPGEPCTVMGGGVVGEDDCDGTSICWDADPRTHMGTCQPFCVGTDARPTCADPCDVCRIAPAGVLLLCFETCDPLAQDCAPGQACYPVDLTFQCLPDLSSARSGIASPCSFVSDCPPGLACLDGGFVPGCADASCCVPYCPAGGADPCPGLLPGTICTPWFEEGTRPPEQCQGALPGLCMLEQGRVAG